MNEAERAAIGDQVHKSQQYCLGKLPACWNTRIRWSSRMTASVGNATQGSPNIIKLSTPIILGVLEDHGLEAALQAIDETIKHEFAHVAVKFADAPAHGQEWAANMRILGVTPDQYHHYRSGRELFSDRELRDNLPCGHEVIFQYKDIWYHGEIISHKTKRVHARAKAKLVTSEWEPLDRGFIFTCPWSMAENELHLVQDPK